MRYLLTDLLPNHHQVAAYLNAEIHQHEHGAHAQQASEERVDHAHEVAAHGHLHGQITELHKEDHAEDAHAPKHHVWFVSGEGVSEISQDCVQNCVRWHSYGPTIGIGEVSDVAS